MNEKELKIETEWLQEGDDIDIQFFWNIIQERFWLITTITALTLVFSAIYAYRLPNIYKSRAKILIERVEQNPYQNPEMFNPADEYGQIYYQTKAEVIKTRSLLIEASREGNLLEYYQKIRPRIKTDEQVAQILASKIDTKLIKGTQIIELSVTDRDPKLAAKIANAVSESFIKESWRERLFISDQVLQWFPEEGKALEQNSPINQLRNLEREDAVASLPSVLKDPILNGIKQERVKVDAQIKELSKRYTPEHPKLKELLARLDYLESEMKVQTERIISGLKSGLSGEFSISNVKILERAVVPGVPAGPRRNSIILISVAVGFVISVILAIFLHHLDQNIKIEEDIRKIPLIFLGYLPLILNLTEKDSKKNLISLIKSDVRLSDDVTNIKASILFSLPADRSKLLMCTSAIPEEGKTTVVSLLGISLAESGEKILMIDADMRKPALHEIFEIENRIGLSNCLIGSAKPKDIIHTIKDLPNLHVMTAGEKTPNPSVLLGSAVLDQMIQELSREYDRIVFDAPPSLYIADGLILAGKVHGTILMFNSGKIHLSVAKKLREKIMLTNGLIVGGIINRADYKKMNYSYYRYYHHYSKYYHKSDDSQELAGTAET